MCFVRMLEALRRSRSSVVVELVRLRSSLLPFSPSPEHDPPPSPSRPMLCGRGDENGIGTQESLGAKPPERGSPYAQKSAESRYPEEFKAEAVQLVVRSSTEKKFMRQLSHKL